MSCSYADYEDDVIELLMLRILGDREADEHVVETAHKLMADNSCPTVYRLAAMQKLAIALGVEHETEINMDTLEQYLATTE